MKKVKIVKVAPDVRTPVYGSEGAACFDISAYIPDGEKKVILAGGNPKVIRTGLKVQLPKDHVLLMFSRSGHGFKSDTRLANCVGVIDEDYTGEVMAKLTNDGFTNILIVNDGDRILQGLVLPIERVEFEEVESLDVTSRGEDGFGSTGVR